MRISRIVVDELFDTFHHDIRLNQSDRVTIIYGPNGFGKTTVLRMVDALMHARYSELRSIHFSDFLVEFSTGDFMRVTRTLSATPEADEIAVDDEAEPDIGWNLEIAYQYGSDQDSYSPSPSRTFNISEAALSMISRQIPALSRIGPRQWRHISTREVLSLEDIIERYGEQLPLEALPPSDEPEVLRSLRKSHEVRMVRTQRLEALRTAPSQVRDRSSSLITRVAQYARELKYEIQQTLGEYGKKSQLLDRTFPNRVIRQLQGSVAEQEETLTGEQLREYLSKQETQVNRYQQGGLLDRQSNSSSNIPLHGVYEDATERVLSVYVKDNQQKLDVLEPLARRVELLKYIINQHFAYKRIVVNSDTGFHFVSKRRVGERIRPSDLSSGEQHLLVLTYELLFKTSENMLIIIDEPEISLHVVWQEDFLKNLQKIVELSPFEVLIATHSPQIIAERWDLAYGLTGPEDLEDEREDAYVR